jgi:nitroreductase
MKDQSNYQPILKLRAMRHYQDRQLSEDNLDAILEAARWTGSSKNSQNWKFVVVKEPDQRAALAEAGSFTDPVRRAPCVIALVDLSSGYEFDVGRAAQNIMLAADAIGVGSCPVTLHDGAKAARVLGIPEGTAVRYAVTLGYPPEGSSANKGFGKGGRKARQEVVSFESY